MRVDLAASLQHHNHKRGTAINDDDRAHYHLEPIHDNDDSDDRLIFYGPGYVCGPDNDCDRTTAVYVTPYTDYQRLVAAARDRHPTNQQRGTDPTRRTDGVFCDACGIYHHGDCPFCPADS